MTMSSFPLLHDTINYMLAWGVKSLTCTFVAKTNVSTTLNVTLDVKMMDGGSLFLLSTLILFKTVYILVVQEILEPVR